MGEWVGPPCCRGWPIRLVGRNHACFACMLNRNCCDLVSPVSHDWNGLHWHWHWALLAWALALAFASFEACVGICISRYPFRICPCPPHRHLAFRHGQIDRLDRRPPRHRPIVHPQARGWPCIARLPALDSDQVGDGSLDGDQNYAGQSTQASNHILGWLCVSQEDRNTYAFTVTDGKRYPALGTCFFIPRSPSSARGRNPSNPSNQSNQSAVTFPINCHTSRPAHALDRLRHRRYPSTSVPPGMSISSAGLPQLPPLSPCASTKTVHRVQECFRIIIIFLLLCAHDCSPGELWALGHFVQSCTSGSVKARTGIN